MLTNRLNQGWGLATLGLLIAALGGLPIQSLEAGVIFVPGKLVKDQFVPPKAEKPAPNRRAEPTAGFGYTIRYGRVTVDVTKGNTTIKAAETLSGPKAETETVCVVPLPIGTSASDAKLMAGKDADTLTLVAGAKFLKADKAQTFYEHLVKQTNQVGFAAFSGQPALVVPSFRLQGRMEFVLELSSPVGEYQGVKNLRIPLPSTSWTQGPVDRLSVTTTIQAKKPVRAVFSPTHQINTQRKSLTSVDVEVRKENAACRGDFRLCWVEDDDDLGLRMLTYRMEGEDDGYFMLLGNPTGRADGSDVVEKDVTFVLDTSGSMRGEKIEQCRAAIEYCLNHLNPKDRFNIVTFGTKVTPFRETLVANSAETVAAAQDFVEEIVAHGRTNINEALIQSLKGEPQKGRPRITIFLTDGTPTEGERLPEKILKAATEANTSQSRIFVMGVGHDVNVHLLEKLAVATEGDSEFVDLEEEIDGKIATLYDRLAYPVLQNAKLDFGKLPVHSVFPRKVPALFRNNPVMLFGRYREGDKHTIKLQGELAGTPREFICQANAPTTPQGLTNEFLAPLWATRKIGFLLQEIRLHGSDPELMKEIVRLSQKYGIITEYTEFVAQSGFGGGFGGGAFGGAVTRTAAPMEAFREANRRLTMARDFDSGRWAFNQARNDKSLQSRLAVNEETNSFVDRAGRKVAYESIRQVGGKAYYMRQGQWVDSTDNAKLKERVVELYSDDYFKLLRKNKDFARAQQLGWSVSVNVGDERIVVEKDGKRVDEKLLKKGQQVPQLPGSNRNQIRDGFRGFQQIPQNELRNFNQQQINQLPLQNNRNIRRGQQIPNRRINVNEKAPAAKPQEEGQ